MQEAILLVRRARARRPAATARPLLKILLNESEKGKVRCKCLFRISGSQPAFFKLRGRIEEEEEGRTVSSRKDAHSLIPEQWPVL